MSSDSRAIAQCAICAFPLARDTDESVFGSKESASCPVCRDGREDPWAIIREVRGQMTRLLSLSENPLAEPEQNRVTVDVPAADWSIIRQELAIVWPRLSLGKLPSTPLDHGQIQQLLEDAYGYTPRSAMELVNGFVVLHERFHGHWNVVSESVERRWRRLPKVQLTKVDTITDLSDLLAVEYVMEPAQARAAIVELLQELHYAELLRLRPSPPFQEGLVQHEAEQRDAC